MSKKKASYKLLLNKVVEVRFLDHIQNAQEPLTCTMWGRVVVVKPKHIVVRAWEAVDNNDDYTLLTSAIESIRELV